MLLINQAWTILSDPSERARYDRSRSIVIHPPGSTHSDYYRASAPSTNATNTAARPTPTRTQPAAPRGTGTSRQSQVRVGGTRTTSRRASSSSPRTRLLTQVFEAAELYFFYGRAGEAMTICRRVLSQDAANSEAYALLGDIYADQGRRDVAVFMYERAVSHAPTNLMYRQKWEALARTPGPTGTAAPTAASVANSATSNSAASNNDASQPTPRSASVNGVASARVRCHLQLHAQ
jgi:curved DNA-binding protein CbpA